MDLTQLKMFCAVADCGSMARAAQQLHRVPSNLTTRLRQLEEELGGDLFIREKQRLRLSPMGHNFLCYARRILVLSEEALNMAHGGKPGGHFAFGAMESTAATRLPLLLAEFHQRYPAVTLALFTGTSGELIERVSAGTLAAALVDGPVNVEELNGCVAFHQEIVLISSPDHRAISRPADAAGSTLFAFRPGCSDRARFENWFRAAGVQPGSVIEIPSYHAMLACVASGSGLALLPAAVLAQLPGHERVRQHPLPPPICETTTLLIWRRDAFSANIEALKYLMIEQFDANGCD
ncbi:putrescine utilization regulator PtrR [Erwinia pyrifoliae]|uniref:putrescine utilization regulator PtrR n=1 Tax=Erwinia pyrifoliae TaxID=79967 RepID=UPI0021F9BCB2|nr:LysR family transcriptional regulator [Erwinia pyrifoliae]UWS31502.1 LysR substrate-binding domain-containing protein [Erwinia pyrifoliae]